MNVAGNLKERDCFCNLIFLVGLKTSSKFLTLPDLFVNGHHLLNRCSTLDTKNFEQFGDFQTPDLFKGFFQCGRKAGGRNISAREYKVTR